VPGLAAIGIITDVVDVSTESEDAALEIMLTCSCQVAAAELGLPAAEPVVCGLDLAATERAFPNLDVTVLARQTDGRNVCVFRFARPRLETS
jgi:predicted ArsR family transcriptional regulator